MEASLEPLLLGLRVLLFISAISCLVAVSTKYTRIESFVKDEVVQIHSDVGQTYEDYESGEQRHISGAAVLSEIMEFDGAIPIVVNGEILNDIRTSTGEPFFQYINKYSELPITEKISINSNYIKECVLDGNGDLIKIEYSLL